MLRDVLLKMMTVCVMIRTGVLILFLRTSEVAPADLALGQPANMSGDDGSVAVLAVEGTTGRCAVTSLLTDPWWRVDLGTSYTVDVVNIVSGADGLTDFEIRVGDNLDNGGNSNQKCGGLYNMTSLQEKSFKCTPGIRGRYVNIRIAGSNKKLNICEVSVNPNPTVNIAANRSASQSTTGWNGSPERAVDGNLESRYDRLSCTHTLQENDPWWRVDLGSSQPVSEVFIVNRDDCCMNRLHNLEIHVGDSLEDNGNSNPRCGGLYSMATLHKASFYCKPRKTGRYVNIRLDRDEMYLTLCEVEVYSESRAFLKNKPVEQTVKDAYDKSFITLVCPEPFGYPEPFVTWVRDGVVLQNSTSDLTLDLSIIAPWNNTAWAIDCVANNKHGSDFHRFILNLHKCQKNSFKNSWHIFSESGYGWEKNRDFCRSRGGDLVSIETEEEWDFINDEIQNRNTIDNRQEWHIGLIKEDANWTWVSGRPLTLCKWSEREATGDGDVGQIHKQSSGKQGRFSDLKRNLSMAFICEIPKEKSLQGYCRDYSGIPCTLEYGNKSWVQNCNFTDYTCQLKCTITSCEGLLNKMPPRFCEEKCSQTYSPLADRCNEVKRDRSSLYQICNTTKCNMTSGEQTFVTKQTCYCNGDKCGLKCNGINCTQKCQERKTVASLSTSPSPSLPPTSLSLPPTSSSSPPTSSSSPPTSSSSPPTSSSSPPTPSSSPPTPSSLPSTPSSLQPESSSSSRKLQKLTSEYLIKLNRINISNSSSLQEATRVFELFITGIENITNAVESFSGTEETKTLRRTTFRVAVAFEEFALNYSKLHTIGRKSAVVIHSHRMGLTIQKVYRQNESDFYFGEQEWNASIKVPSANFANNVSMVVGIVYKNLHDLLIIDRLIGMKTSNRSYLGSRIMAATMDPKPNKLRENVILKFRNLRVDGEKKCVFWSGFSESTDGFSERGCQVVTSKSDSEETVCSCNHLTHFALLVDYNGIPGLTKEDETKLEIITYAGLSLSIIGILLTIILYSFLKDVRQPLSQIRLSLSVSLGAGQVIFLAGVNATENTVSCVTAAALMQYFLMAAFCWMLVEGFYLYLFVVKVYNISEKMLMYHVMSWGLPIIMVGISLCVAAGKDGIGSYTNDKYCWLSSTNNLIWIFVAFVAFMEVLNIFILVRVIKEMNELMQPTGEDNHTQQIQLCFKTCAVMIPLLGVTWVFGLLLPLHKAFAYIFTISNSTQGFLIFVFHCVRDSQIRERLKRKMNTIFPSTDNGRSAKKSSQVNPSDVGNAWAVELQSFHE